MRHETLLYVGDGIRAPETDELVGSLVKVNGRRGKVVKNDAFTITVAWDWSSLLRPWPCRKIRWGFCLVMGAMWGFVAILYIDSMIKYGFWNFMGGIGIALALIIPILGCMPVGKR